MRQELLHLGPRARGRIGSAALVVAIFTASAGIAHADSAVILGAGQIGSWFMSAYVSNPNTSQNVVTVSSNPLPASLRKFASTTTSLSTPRDRQACRIHSKGFSSAPFM